MLFKSKQVASMVLAAVAAITASGASAQVDMKEGKKLFTQTATPACAVCHTLEHAGTQGAIGPNLNELKPDAFRVETALRNGIGQMPAYKNLTEQQIKTLAKYVATATGAEK